MADRMLRAEKVYEFDRYRRIGFGRKKMAQGARVRACNEREAHEKARRLFSEPGCRNDTFELRGTE